MTYKSFILITFCAHYLELPYYSKILESRQILFKVAPSDSAEEVFKYVNSRIVLKKGGKLGTREYTQL
jgi:hypothetical protein